MSVVDEHFSYDAPAFDDHDLLTITSDIARWLKENTEWAKIRVIDAFGLRHGLPKGHAFIALMLRKDDLALFAIAFGDRLSTFTPSVDQRRFQRK